MSLEIRNSYVRVFVDVSFFLCTILFPIMMFMIFTKSQLMPQYRFYLLNSVVWCYVYHLLIYLNPMAACFPTPCFIIQPMIPTSHTVVYFFFYLAAFSIINMNLSNTWSLSFRFNQAFPSWLRFYYEHIWIFYSIYFLVHLTVYSLIIVPMGLGQRWDVKEAARRLRFERPDLLLLPTDVVICFENEQHFRLFEFGLANFLLFGLFVWVVLYGILWVQLRTAKHSLLHTRTLSLQIMLFKAFTCQLYNNCFFLLLPIVIQGFLVYYQFPNTGPLTTAFLALMGAHGVVDDLSMLFFITPWRRTVISWIRKKDSPVNTLPLTATSRIQ